MKRKLEDTLFESPISFRNAKSILKDHFTTASKIDFLASEVESSPSLASTIPPLIFGHSALCEVLFDEKHGVDTKLAVLKLLKSCFLSIKDSNVENCMRDAHIPLLLGAYGAKLSKTDQVIYEILRLYERRAGVDFSKYYPLVWGDVGLQKYASLKTLGLALWNRPTADEVLECLDPKTMKISSLWLPLEVRTFGFSSERLDQLSLCRFHARARLTIKTTPIVTILDSCFRYSSTYSVRIRSSIFVVSLSKDRVLVTLSRAYHYTIRRYVVRLIRFFIDSGNTYDRQHRRRRISERNLKSSTF